MAIYLNWILGLWIDYDKIDYWSIIVMCDQLSPFSQLIGRSCDHHFILVKLYNYNSHEWRGNKWQMTKRSSCKSSLCSYSYIECLTGTCDLYAIQDWCTYHNGSFIHRMILSQISQKVAFRENIIVNSYVRVALLQCYILAIANRFVKIKWRMFTETHSWNINPVKKAITVVHWLLY